MSNNELRVGVCAGTVVTKHTWDVAGQIEALTGVPVELVTVRIARDGHAYPDDPPVNALRAALRDGTVDLVVHCLDEVPVPDAADLTFITPGRASVKEALCTTSGDTLAELPRGSRVSVDTELRAATLRALRPDLESVMTHGSLAHRINQLFEPDSDLQAVLAGYADLLAIGRTELVAEVFEPGDIPPTAGQGAIAIETTGEFLAANPWLVRAFARIDNLPTRLSTRAERALTAVLAGQVADPVGTWGRMENGQLLLGAAIIGEDQIRHRAYAQIPLPDGGSHYSAAEQAELDQMAGDLGRKVAAHLIELGANSLRARPLSALTSRFKPRTIIIFIVSIIALIVVITTFDFAKMRDAIINANPLWIAAAVGLSLVTTIGAALTLVAFAPTPLPFGKTMLAQFAGSFVALATPAGIGPAALNLRFLNRQKIATSTGLAVVALTQVSQVAVTVLLLILLTFTTGSERLISLPSTPILLSILGVLLVIAGLMLIPRIRNWLWNKIAPTLHQIRPRLFEMLSQPARLAAGLGGNVLMSVGFVLAFYASIQAFGRELNIIQVAIIFLVGNTAGALIPTPGGLVGVEGALIAGLTAAGLPVAIATSVTLLFRLVTYWLRIPIGYLAMKYLESKNDL